MKQSEESVSITLKIAKKIMGILAWRFVPTRSTFAAARSKYEFSEYLSLVLHDCNLFSKIFLSLLTFFFLKATREIRQTAIRHTSSTENNSLAFAKFNR